MSDCQIEILSSQAGNVLAFAARKIFIDAMSTTPRTDRFWMNPEYSHLNADNRIAGWSDFARQLETDLTVMTQLRDNALADLKLQEEANSGQWVAYQSDLAASQAEVERLTACPDHPYVKQLQAEVERLKAALRSSCDDERSMTISEGVGHTTCGIADELTARSETAEAELAASRELLASMLNVAENCDETGYADGVGFVDIDKLHSDVRSALAAKEGKT